MATFTNQATLTYNGTTALSNVTTGQILQNLTAEKTALQQTYAAGDRITYVLSLINSGSSALQELTVTDDLGAFVPAGQTEPLYPLTYDAGSAALYVNGVLQPAPKATAAAPLTLTGISIPAGGNALIVYSAQVNGSAPLEAGSAIENTAGVDGADLPEPLSASATVSVSEEPLLTVEKTLSPLTVSPDQQVTYSFLISNYGNTEAGADANAVISDTVTPPLSGLTATYNGTLWTEGTEYTYSETTGEFVSAAGAITVPAATYTTAPDGTVTTVPGTATLVLEGTV